MPNEAAVLRPRALPCLANHLGVGFRERIVAHLRDDERLRIISAVEGIINDAVLHAIVAVANGNRGSGGGV